MDFEAAIDKLSVDDGKLVVFKQTTYAPDHGNQFTKKIRSLRTNNASTETKHIILKGASGVIRPGRLTIILGPSGAGKTTLLKILAGRKKNGVTGFFYGAGRNAVFVAQNATLMDTLTTKETLQFAARLKLPNVSEYERSDAIRTVSNQLGIDDVLKTKAGLLSGGERKRLTIACELLTDPQIMLLDEPTSGLDSVSSLSVTKALRLMARCGRTVACVVHQPSSKLYSMADDLILLANGRTLYTGSVADAPDVFSRAGFICPQYYNMADYCTLTVLVLEICSGEHDGDLALLENEAQSFTQEMIKVARNDVLDKQGKDTPTDAEALLTTNKEEHTESYKANFGEQLETLLWRSFLGAMRDVHLTQIRLVCHLIVALLLGALYAGAGADGARVISNTACLFFFLLFLFFSNAMPTIHTFPVEATVVLQEHLNKWYSLTAYCISKILVDLPIQLLCATIFVFPAWYLTSQPTDSNRLILAWLICILVTILAQTFGLMVGTACGVKLGLFVVPAANIPMLMFSEFFIPYHEMPFYLRPFATISYFKYAFEGLLQTAYGFGRNRLPCHEIYCVFNNPHKYLENLGLTGDFMVDVYALIIWIILLQIGFVCVLYYRVYRACR